MRILDNKLENIISNSGIYFYNEEVENEIDIRSKLVSRHDVMQNIWNALPSGANIAIYGLGTAFTLFLSDIDLSTKNLVYMIDKRPNLNTFRGYPVIRVEDIPKHSIDIILVLSYLYSDEMENNVKKYSVDCKIVNIVKAYYSFWNYAKYRDRLKSIVSEDTYVNYLSLYEAVKLYCNNNDFRYNSYIIYSYLMFRDLKNALIFIDKYINSAFPDTEKMINLKNSLNDMLNEIKQALASKEASHSLVFIPDGVGLQMCTPENAPFIYKFSQENIFCPNAYTHSGWTSTSILTLFKQQNYIDNHLYSNPTLSGNESFFKYITENDIDFTYYSAFVKELFHNTSNYYEVNQAGCANIFWQYLCDAFEKDRKTISCLHLSETHGPWLTTEYKSPSNFSGDSGFFLHSLKYVDSQMEYFFNLLPKTTKILITSDHGDIMPEYLTRRCNVIYTICDRITSHRTDERLVSHLDTANIILNLINDKPAFDSIPTKTIVEVNQEFYYSRVHLEDIKYDLSRGRAFKCFFSHTDKYLIFCDGEERYFLLPDDETNLINDPQYTERINWFRTNINTEFPDWSDDNGRYDITRQYMDINKRIDK